MGRIGITYQEVAEAVSELQGKQKHPTVDNVRDILGTGSKSTIARFLREWKANHGLNGDDDGSIPSELSAIVKGLWERLKNKAETQATEYRQDADTKVTQMQQQLNQLRQSQADLQSKIHALEEQLHHQTESNQHLTSELIIEQKEKTKMVERVTSLESRRQESQAENERLHQLLKHVQGNLEHYQAATQKLREEQSLLADKQRNDYEQRISLLQTQAAAFSNEKSVCQAQHDHLKKIHESLVTDHNILTTQHAKIQSQHGSMKMTYDSIQHDHDVLKKQNQAQAIELTTLQNTLVELRLHMQSKDEKIASLEDNVAKANDKIEALRHESQFALQEKSNLEGQLKQMQVMLSSGKVRVAS